MHPEVKSIVERFALAPHPEGGFFREVYRSSTRVEHPANPESNALRLRSGGTHIYFLLAKTDFSAWHRVHFCDELWHLYAGGPLELHTIDDAGRHVHHLLTNDVTRGEPLGVVPAGWWQAARPGPGSEYSFVGCTVVPGFDFADFDLPPAADIVAVHPQHESIIRELTRR